jgi:hypothetical protein
LTGVGFGFGCGWISLDFTRFDSDLIEFDSDMAKFEIDLPEERGGGHQ